MVYHGQADDEVGEDTPSAEVSPSSSSSALLSASLSNVSHGGGPRRKLILNLCDLWTPFECVGENMLAAAVAVLAVCAPPCAIAPIPPYPAPPPPPVDPPNPPHPDPNFPSVCIKPMRPLPPPIMPPPLPPPRPPRPPDSEATSDGMSGGRSGGGATGRGSTSVPNPSSLKLGARTRDPEHPLKPHPAT